MTTSLQSKNSRTEINIKEIARRLLSIPVVSISRFGGGLNSRVYQLVMGDASKYVLKFYHRDHTDKRDRLSVEFSSLKFLWKNGIRTIPQPLAVDESEGCAIYEFIDGKNISRQEIKSRDISLAVQFLAELKSLKGESGIISSASEAFFSVLAVNRSIQIRLDQLKKIKGCGEEYENFHHYLDYDFVPFWETLTRWVKNKCLGLGISFDDNISEDEKILSPSDFGFHNTLRDKAGRIVFLDFEHFGWDDPAKTISDFLLHPAMVLREDLKQQFVQSMLELFKDCKQLKQRVKILYPIFGLKWCLIFLNEFIPGDLRRRNFAQIETMSEQKMLKEQLIKAERMLKAMKQTYKEFPYNGLV